MKNFQKYVLVAHEQLLVLVLEGEVQGLATPESSATLPL